MNPAATRLQIVGNVVDHELLYLERLMAQMVDPRERKLTMPEIQRALAAQARMSRILWGRREELRPWGVE